jgi:LDH2 family malate/lactate/ureidoglycolate dehydrogenase
MSHILLRAQELKTLVAAVLAAAGASESNADCVADHLVSANLCGVDTHGVWHVAGYVSAIKSGEIVPDALPEVKVESCMSALVTGRWTFGQVAAKYAMEKAIEKAVQHSMSVVSLVQSHHIGRLGEYAEMASAKGLISMIFGGGYAEENPVAVPFGGVRRTLSTNPIAMAFPAGAGDRMLFDFATTAASGVKVANARKSKEELPPAWIVDKAGNPSTNAEDFFDGGGYLPFGGHKGYALMVGAEFLGRIFSGSDHYAETGRGGPIMSHQGVTMILLKADLFQSRSDCTEKADELLRRIRSVPPAPGFTEVQAPGDPEQRTRKKREHEGIPIPEELWRELTGLAESFRVETALLVKK